MSTKTPVKTIQHWLMVITNNKADSSYINGIRLFMKDWDKKTPAKIKRLCEQIKEVVASDDAFSIYVFGTEATSFFKELDTEKIAWK